MKKKMSLSNKTIIALIVGILCGLFFGDECAYLKPFGDVFIKIMQITVIPYIVVSLLHGIGGLTKKEAKSIAIKGSLVLISFWIITIVLFFAMQHTFPAIKSASFYSSSSNITESTNYMDLFIPSNPFASLSNSAVPAIVIFCVLLGIALVNIKSEEKISILNVLNLLCKSIERVTKMLFTIIPYGTFALTAYTAGTITGDSIEIMAIYIIGYIICSLFIVILVIPLIISSITRFTYSDIMSEVKGVLVFTFVTGNLFITIPLIMESVNNIFEKYNSRDEHVDGQIKSLIPIYYTLPGIGRLSVMFFILFVAWFYNNQLTFLKQLEFGTVGLFSLFASPFLALPFLLDYLKLPSDAFNLYVASNQIIRKFGLILDVMGLFSCTLICVSLYTNFKLQIRKLVKSIILISIIFIMILSGLRFFFNSAFPNLYTGDKQLLSMTLLKNYQGENYTDLISTKIYNEIPKHLLNTTTAINGKTDTFSQIKTRKVLRVGYFPGAVPFSFLNRKGDLVGYDIQIAYEFALFLNCLKIEFIPLKSEWFQNESFEKILNNRVCDIIMGPVSINSERMSRMIFSSSNMALTPAMVVKDYRKKEFTNIKQIKKIKSLKIAIVKGMIYGSLISKLFPNAEIIEIEDYNVFFKTEIADALMIAAEEGFAWTLLYPYFAVSTIAPHGDEKDFVGYPVALDGGEQFISILNSWLAMNKNGIIHDSYEYWILGKKRHESPSERWSVIRNILHLNL